MTDYPNSIAPLVALERIMAHASPEEIPRATDMYRKIVRAYARTTRSRPDLRDRAQEELRQVIHRAQPNLSPEQRTALLEQLVYTFRVWSK